MFTLPGTFLKIWNQGVLLKGQSGSGKSVLSLELIHRGHQLVADDVVWFEKKRQKIRGKCPPTIQDFMYVKEFGIIDVRKIFGANAICLNTELKLVIQLSSEIQSLRRNTRLFSSELASTSECTSPPRFSKASSTSQKISKNLYTHSVKEGDQNFFDPYKTLSILDIDVPMLIMPAHPLPPVLVETAVRDLALKAQGYFAFDKFNHDKKL